MELLEDIIESTRTLDHVLLTATELVNHYTHGLPGDPKLYLPHTHLGGLK